ncbi:hypothetical protein EXIGLDRAFT_726239 [Exidia glandulosa HHB12029]|uniref:Uncharacterized protein n=1 Tax=Exidia glandulosa HHB12029 TaxID=1314781 RepID=A0A165MF07_EXIGL|nr:hypothetical protein EXIGLDRAFT_726239 [Exidia glandulosa HHB12029]
MLKFLSPDVALKAAWESLAPSCKLLKGSSYSVRALTNGVVAVEQCIKENSVAPLRDHFYEAIRLQHAVIQDATRPNDQDMSATRDAFRRQYVGSGDELLLHIVDNGVDHLRKNLQSLQHPQAANVYAKSFVVVQSSGMGKSRTVAQAAQKRFAMIFNLREQTPQGYAFPEPDVSVSEFLRHGKDDSSSRQRAVVFLCFLLQAVLRQLRTGSFFMDRSIARQWCEWLEHNRTTFLQSVVDEAKQALDASPDHVYDDALHDAAQSLQARLLDWRHDKNMILCFDEAHTLLEKPNESQRSPYHHLESALNIVQEFKIFALFMSTVSLLGDLAYTADRHPSYRVQTNSSLFPPITELPFDVFASSILQNGPVTMQEVMQVKSAAKFGRPLWYTMFEALEARGSATTVVDVAVQKLLPGTDDSIARFARLAIRLCFDMNSPGNPAARDVDAKLVKTYMRVVYSVPSHRMFMATGTPSEPILVEAAARLLEKNKRAGRADDYIDILVKAVEWKWIAKGLRGEMVLRLLWILARDAGLEELPESEPADSNRIVSYQRPLGVVQFLESLLAPEAARLVLKLKPIGDPDNGLTLKEAFAHASINFSHFALAGDNDVLRKKPLSKLLMRGVALQCLPHQRDIDAAGPVHFEKDARETPITPESTGIMQGQAKNRVDTKDELISPSVADDWDQPVLTLFHEFGEDRSEGVTFPNSPSTTRSGNNAHKRHYQVVIKGLSRKVYGSKVVPEDVTHLRFLLGQGKLLDDYPRSMDAECVNAVMGQKPYFTKDNVDWA